MARAGLCSRRDAETWIKEGRVSVNGKVLDTPAVNIHAKDKVLVDGAPLPVRERTRLWLYHKPKGLVTTTSDPEGRPTVFEKLPQGLPRVITVGRLDINTEGLLLLTNDGGLARVLELPTTGWLRRYRVRAYGRVTQAQLDTLADGIALEGVLYGSIDAQLEREVGDNVWITVALREGKNREVKKVLGHLGLDVNRLIRVSYGPFQLLDLDEGKVQEVKGRILRDQLGERLVEESGADFDAPILTEIPRKSPSRKRKTIARSLVAPRVAIFRPRKARVSLQVRKAPRSVLMMMIAATAGDAQIVVTVLTVVIVLTAVTVLPKEIGRTVVIAEIAAMAMIAAMIGVTSQATTPSLMPNANRLTRALRAVQTSCFAKKAPTAKKPANARYAKLVDARKKPI